MFGASRERNVPQRRVNSPQHGGSFILAVGVLSPIRCRFDTSCHPLRPLKKKNCIYRHLKNPRGATSDNSAEKEAAATKRQIIATAYRQRQNTNRSSLFLPLKHSTIHASLLCSAPSPACLVIFFCASFCSGSCSRILLSRFAKHFIGRDDAALHERFFRIDFE